MNETKLVNSYPKELTNIEGYQLEREDRNANGGGVALYISEPIQYIRRTDLPENDLELICAEIKPPKSRPYIVIVWYRPPSDPVDSFNKLETILSYLDREGKEIILLGDTNCDFASKSTGQLSDNNAKHLRSIYDLFSFTQLVEEPTRVTLETATLIDHIATTCPNNILESGVLKISMSDHYMVYCIRKLNGSFKKDHKTIKTRNMKNFSERAFLQDVATIDWHDVLGTSEDVNKLVERFSTVFSFMVEKHAPLRQIRVSEKYCPWINADLKRLIRTRDRLKRFAVKHKSQVAISSYKQCRNQVNTLNVTLKRQYFSHKILQQKGNMKESWQTVNQLLNKPSKSTNIDSLSDSSQTLSDKQKISDKMNEFFCSVGKKLAADIDVTPNPLLSGEFSINDGEKIFNIREINEGDLQKAMAKMKIKKSFGNDNISGYFLKIAFAVISSSLLRIFNVSIETNTFPDTWKIARVTPIYKEGEKSEKSNYRPISVLPVISRLFEKIIFDQLYQYMNGSGLLSPDQSGFRALHSTNTCLLKCTDDWFNGIDQGLLTGMIFIDLKKAFDTVDHEILCKKLAHYGVLGRGLSWFKSYLANRKQYCRVNGVDSNMENIEVGVPQGSCLGPLLFLVYINDLPCIIKNSKVSMYADDTSLYNFSKDISQLNGAINEDLGKLDRWLKGNRLSLNVTKTHSMLITTKHKKKYLGISGQTFQPCIRETNVEVISNTKYLGVQIDEHLSWKEHIKAVTAKASRAIGLLKYAKKYLPIAVVKTLYSSIVEPHFQYCCSVWGCCNSTDISQLQRLQNRAARVLTNREFDAPSKPLIESLGWQTIGQLIDRQSKLTVFKCLNDLAPRNLSELFTKNVECASRNLRNTSTDLRLPLKSSSTGQKCFSFRGAKIWNCLSMEAKQAATLNAFKTQIKI